MRKMFTGFLPPGAIGRNMMLEFELKWDESEDAVALS
jgi:hypothetical protein